MITSVELSPLYSLFFSEAKRDQMLTILQGYEKIYQDHFARLFNDKMGIVDLDRDNDMRLVAHLLQAMYNTKADFTQTFRDLSELSLDDIKANKIPDAAWGLQRVKDSEEYKKFVDSYVKRLGDTDDTARMELMQRSNPRYILRNWLAQRAIEKAEEDDFSEVQKLLRVLKNPYKIQPEAEDSDYAKPPPGWSKELKVSCSS